VQTWIRKTIPEPKIIYLPFLINTNYKSNLSTRRDDFQRCV